MVGAGLGDGWEFAMVGVLALAVGAASVAVAARALARPAISIVCRLGERLLARSRERRAMCGRAPRLRYARE